MYGRLKADVREIIKKLCDYRNIEIVEGAVCADYVHLCLSIPPSEKVSDVVGRKLYQPVQSAVTGSREKICGTIQRKERKRTVRNRTENTGNNKSSCIALKSKQ